MEATAIAKTEELQQLVATTNNALQLNQISVDKAKEAGFALLEEIETKGMSDDIDTQCNIILVKYRKTLQMVQGRRKPVTQMFDQIKKVFTALEAEVDPKNKNSVYAQIQEHRNNYAREKAEEQRKREEEAKRKLAIENEKTEVRAKIELALSDYFESYLQERSRYLLNLFESVTLQTFPKCEAELKSFDTTYPKEHFDKFTSTVHVIYIGQDVIVEIIGLVKTEEAYKKFAETYWREIEVQKMNLVEKLPGKLEELKAIAEAEKADKEEADRLRAEQEQRKKDEEVRLAKEEEERKQKREAEIESQQKAGQMQNMFDATEASKVDNKQVRTGYGITVTHQKGWAEIFHFWWTHEGNDLPLDKIARKNMEQMKTFAQNYAHKNGEKIQSPYLKYEETFKAVARA